MLQRGMSMHASFRAATLTFTRLYAELQSWYKEGMLANRPRVETIMEFGD